MGENPSEASHLCDLILIPALFHICPAPTVFTKISPFQSGLGQEDLGGDLSVVCPFPLLYLGFFYSILKILTPESRENTHCQPVTKMGFLHSVRETGPGT